MELMQAEQVLALELAVARLPEDYRRVIQLRYHEERSFETIAELMERSPNAVRKLWSRAIERLQLEMDATSMNADVGSQSSKKNSRPD